MSGSCIFVDHAGMATWGEAKRTCELLGSSLIKITDLELWFDVTTYIYQNTSATGKDFWFGANDSDYYNGTWVWTDGSPVMSGSPLWYPGEPKSTPGNYYYAATRTPY